MTWNESLFFSDNQFCANLNLNSCNFVYLFYDSSVKNFVIFILLGMQRLSFQIFLSSFHIKFNVFTHINVFLSKKNIPLPQNKTRTYSLITKLVLLICLLLFETKLKIKNQLFKKNFKSSALSKPGSKALIQLLSDIGFYMLFLEEL